MSSPEALQEIVDLDAATRAKDRKIPSKKALAARILITIAALAIWFGTQSLLGARIAPTEGIGDGLHRLTAPLNAYLHGAPRAANALLIASSALIDAIAIFLLGSWIFAGQLRPFLGLAMLLVTRQVMQALCSLPAPPGIIWHDPGFPSLLVTYGVANDFFFSGHTAISVFGAIEVARLRRAWLTVLAACVVLFEVAAVLVLRAHYTMDVFTGALAAACVAQICGAISDWFARFRIAPAD
jgi:membrane-associated phospholipid phosphatase